MSVAVTLSTDVSIRLCLKQSFHTVTEGCGPLRSIVTSGCGPPVKFVPLVVLFRVLDFWYCDESGVFTAKHVRPDFDSSVSKQDRLESNPVRTTH